MKQRKMEKAYEAVGWVKGKSWMGSTGFYLSRKVSGTTKKEVMRAIEEGVKDGSLDKGFGFQSLLGFMGILIEKSWFNEGKKTFVSETKEIIGYGNLTDDDWDMFFADLLYHL